MSAEVVIQYLQSNPQFFEQYADVLADIFVPHPYGGRTISLSERQMLTLRDKNKQLEAKLVELITFGEENDAISEKMHRLAVALVEAERFQTVIHHLNFHLRDDFAVPHVALRLWNKPAGVGDLPEFAAVEEELRIFAETLTKPYCGFSTGLGTDSWFGESASHIRSQALVALGSGSAKTGHRTLGMLALGSEDPQRFYPDMGTLYLERLGDLVSAALIRVEHQDGIRNLAEPAANV